MGAAASSTDEPTEEEDQAIGAARDGAREIERAVRRAGQSFEEADREELAALVAGVEAEAERGIRRNCRTELARGVVLIAERHGHRHWRGHAVRSSAGGAFRGHETQETGGREVVAGGREPLDRRRDQEDFEMRPGLIACP